MATLNSLIITNLIQKVKENFSISCSKYCIIISLCVSFVIGTLFSMTFSNLDFIPCLWSSLFSFIGSDMLYNVLEGKIFKSLSDIKDDIKE